MLKNDFTPAAMAEALAKSADYRVLQRPVRRGAFTPPVGQSTKTGILLDVETMIWNLHSDPLSIYMINHMDPLQSSFDRAVHGAVRIR
ncbi:hypothetical protein V1286_007637 [Bradyrhizobium algeriense]|uniref:Uncharacterized protein n=1 Tax=Bradyrhizobium algeriense TaxID=634784 RepID=A0ABU8BQB8_9BRAD